MIVEVVFKIGRIHISRAIIAEQAKSFITYLKFHSVLVFKSNG